MSCSLSQSPRGALIAHLLCRQRLHANFHAHCHTCISLSLPKENCLTCVRASGLAARGCPRLGTCRCRSPVPAVTATAVIAVAVAGAGWWRRDRGAHIRRSGRHDVHRVADNPDPGYTRAQPVSIGNGLRLGVRRRCSCCLRAPPAPPWGPTLCTPALRSGPVIPRSS